MGSQSILPKIADQKGLTERRPAQTPASQ